MQNRMLFLSGVSLKNQSGCSNVSFIVVGIYSYSYDPFPKSFVRLGSIADKKIKIYYSNMTFVPRSKLLLEITHDLVVKRQDSKFLVLVLS